MPRLDLPMPRREHHHWRSLILIKAPMTTNSFAFWVRPVRPAGKLREAARNNKKPMGRSKPWEKTPYAVQKPQDKGAPNRLFLVAASGRRDHGGGDRLAGILVCQVAPDRGRRDSLDDA